MVIRRAKQEDIGRLLDLLSEILEIHAKLRPDLFASGTTKYSRIQLEAMVRDDTKPIYVAEMGGYVVGYAMCQIRMPSSNMYPVKIFHLDDLCVDEAARGRHIGKTLFEYVKGYAREKGCHNITLHAWECNPAAMAFYRSLGLKTQYTCFELICD